MDEQLTRHASGEAAAPEESGLAARLIRDEFGEPTSVFDETAQVPVAAPAAPAVADGAAIHEEFAEPARATRSRSHRTGMLAGLGVVGALLAVLVVLSPGSGQPRLPVQSVHDVTPIIASGPKTAAATAPPPTAASPTTSSTIAPSAPTTQPHRTVTAPTTVTVVYLPGTTTQAQTQTPATSAPAPAPTTAPPPPTTTTTLPPTTTTTAKPCFLLCLG